MKQKLLALAALVASAVGGTVLFVNFEDAAVQFATVDVGNWEVVDRDSCSMVVCTTQQCQAAQNILEDAGSSCIPRFADCDFRVGQKMRNLALDAGVTLGPQKYQRLRLIALRCPAVGGGFAFGVPMRDSGWPVYAVATQTPRCVRAPVAGGDCQRRLSDGGLRYFGDGNVMPADAGVGAQCEPVGCGFFYGDTEADL